MWSTSYPNRFTPENETLNQIYSRLIGPQGRSERVQKFSPPSDFAPHIFYSVMRCYTDNIIIIHLFLLLFSYFYIALFFLYLSSFHSILCCPLRILQLCLQPFTL